MTNAEDTTGPLPILAERENDEVGPLPTEMTANNGDESDSEQGGNQKRRHEVDANGDNVEDDSDIAGPLPSMMEVPTAEPPKKKCKKGKFILELLGKLLS